MRWNRTVSTIRALGTINVGDQEHAATATTFYIEAFGALPAAPALDHVLVIGSGTSSTAEAVLTMPGVGRLTIVPGAC